MSNDKTIKHDCYIFMEVTWKDGFKHIVTCRGYNLKSQIAFTKSLFWVDSYNWYEVSKEIYDDWLWGSYSEETTLTKENNNERRTRKNETQRKNSPKGSDSKEKIEDSKGIRSARKRATSPGKEKPTVLRKPKVRDVRQSKEDSKGTDNPGKATPSGTRRTTRQKK